jgi:DNA-binding transcriptional ArsR family regulator
MGASVVRDKIEEETYSLILSALKHPLRRKILRMLADKPHNFSEILESLAIDSGHLNYHIKSMGDIVTQTEDGKYALSSVGLAAIELVGKVEEQDKSTKTKKRSKRISKLAMIFSAIFAIALLTATVYTLTFTTQNQGSLFEPHQELENILFSIGSGQVFSYNMTIDHLDSDSGFGHSITQQETTVYIPQTSNDVTRWIRYFSNTNLELNGTYKVSIEIYSPDGNKIEYMTESGAASPILDVPLNFEFTKLGTYRLLIENLGEDEFNATIIPLGNFIIYEKPLFNYGILGIILLSVYPVLIFVSWNWKKRSSR